MNLQLQVFPGLTASLMLTALTSQRSLPAWSWARFLWWMLAPDPHTLQTSLWEAMTHCDNYMTMRLIREVELKVLRCQQPSPSSPVAPDWWSVSLPFNLRSFTSIHMTFFWECYGQVPIYLEILRIANLFMLIGLYGVIQVNKSWTASLIQHDSSGWNPAPWYTLVRIWFWHTTSQWLALIYSDWSFMRTSILVMSQQWG